MTAREKSSILLIYTGGTIGMKEDPAVQALRPFDFSQILEEVPELGKFAYRISRRNKTSCGLAQAAGLVLILVRMGDRKWFFRRVNRCAHHIGLACKYKKIAFHNLPHDTKSG